MSEVIGKFAKDIADAAESVLAVSTVGIGGEFGDQLRRKQERLAGTLTELGVTLEALQTSRTEHRASETRFVNTAPTLAEIEEARDRLVAAQTVRQSVDEGAVAPVTLGLDLVQMGVAEQAQTDLTALTEQRRDAVRVFHAEQERLHAQISSTAMPAPDYAEPYSEDGVGGAAPGGRPVLPLPGPGAGSGDYGSAPSPGLSSGSDTAEAEQSRSGGPVAATPTGTSAGTPGGTAGAAPGGMVPAALAPTMRPGAVTPAVPSNRIGPPVMPGYTIPGTTTSAGGPAPMSDRDFNSLLDRLKPDRSTPSTPTPVSPSGTGGGGTAGAAPAAARVVQPPSWTNASTSPTGVSDGHTGRGAVSAAPAGTAGHPRTGMPMMPMMPGAANPGAAGRDQRDAPQIKNADPDLYGDDVQTVEPIIDNQEGRFT